jgi:hypothetical protein
MSAQPPARPDRDDDAIGRSGERIQRAIEWIEAHWRTEGVDHACEVCGNDVWEVGYPVLLYFWDPPEPGAAVPHFPITCRGCGNTKLLNAVTAGLLDADETR